MCVCLEEGHAGRFGGLGTQVITSQTQDATTTALDGDDKRVTPMWNAHLDEQFQAVTNSMDTGPYSLDPLHVLAAQPGRLGRVNPGNGQLGHQKLC